MYQELGKIKDGYTVKKKSSVLEYMLRQAKYSMSAIHKSLKKFDAGCKEEALDALHNLNEEDIVWTGDHLLYTLRKTADKAEEILKILDNIEE